MPLRSSRPWLPSRNGPVLLDPFLFPDKTETCIHRWILQACKCWRLTQLNKSCWRPPVCDSSDPQLCPFTLPFSPNPLFAESQPPCCSHVNSFPFFFKNFLNKNCIYLRCATWWFDRNIHTEVMAAVELINIPSLPSYHFSVRDHWHLKYIL